MANHQLMLFTNFSILDSIPHACWVFGLLMMLFAALNIDSALRIPLVGDRGNDRLHSMVTSDLRVWMYWLANWCFDVIICIFYLM
jgi:hypothetical protein